MDVLQQFGGSIGGAIVRNRAWFFADYEQHNEKNPISVINEGFSEVDQTDFQVPDDVQLPPPTGQFPMPGSLTEPDPTSPKYLQNVANALYGIESNLGVRPRFRNDWSLFSKLDYRDRKDDRFYLSVNWNRFDSPSGIIVNSQTPLFGISTLANSFVRDYHASAGWSHAYGSNLLNEVHVSFLAGRPVFNADWPGEPGASVGAAEQRRRRGHPGCRRRQRRSNSATPGSRADGRTKHCGRSQTT